MTDPTALTLAQARDLLRQRTISAVELAEAHLAAIGEARALNACVLETPERARAMAKRATKGSRKRGRAARRDRARRQGSVRHRRRAHHGLLAHPRRFRADLRVDRHGQSLARRRRDAGQAQQRRVRHGLVERDLLLRPGVSPWRRKGSDAKLVPGGSSGGSAARSRPISASARSAPTPAARSASPRPTPASWASSRPMAAARAGAWSPTRPRSIRPGRSAHRARLRDPAALHGRTRRQGHDLGRYADPRLRSGGRQIDQGHEDRIPKEYRVPGMAAEIEALWQRAPTGSGARAPRSWRCHCPIPNMRCLPITSWRRRKPRPISRATTACA